MEDDMPLPHEQRPMNNRDLADQQTTQDPGQHSPNDTPLDPIRDQINGVAQELKRALEQAPQSAQEPSLALGHLQSIIETQMRLHNERVKAERQIRADREGIRAAQQGLNDQVSKLEDRVQQRTQNCVRQEFNVANGVNARLQTILESLKTEWRNVSRDDRNVFVQAMNEWQNVFSGLEAALMTVKSHTTQAQGQGDKLDALMAGQNKADGDNSAALKAVAKLVQLVSKLEERVQKIAGSVHQNQDHVNRLGDATSSAFDKQSSKLDALEAGSKDVVEKVALTVDHHTGQLIHLSTAVEQLQTALTKQSTQLDKLEKLDTLIQGQQSAKAELPSAKTALEGQLANRKSLMNLGDDVAADIARLRSYLEKEFGTVAQRQQFATQDISAARKAETEHSDSVTRAQQNIADLLNAQAEQLNGLATTSDFTATAVEALSETVGSKFSELRAAERQHFEDLMTGHTSKFEEGQTSLSQQLRDLGEEQKPAISSVYMIRTVVDAIQETVDATQTTVDAMQTHATSVVEDVLRRLCDEVANAAEQQAMADAMDELQRKIDALPTRVKEGDQQKTEVLDRLCKGQEAQNTVWRSIRNDMLPSQRTPSSIMLGADGQLPPQANDSLSSSPRRARLGLQVPPLSSLFLPQQRQPNRVTGSQSLPNLISKRPHTATPIEQTQPKRTLVTYGEGRRRMQPDDPDPSEDQGRAPGAGNEDRSGSDIDVMNTARSELDEDCSEIADLLHFYRPRSDSRHPLKILPQAVLSALVPLLQFFADGARREKLLQSTNTLMCARQRVGKRNAKQPRLETCKICVALPTACIMVDKGKPPTLVPLPAHLRQGKTENDPEYWMLAEGDEGPRMA